MERGRREEGWLPPAACDSDPPLLSFPVAAAKGEKGERGDQGPPGFPGRTQHDSQHRHQTSCWCRFSPFTLNYPPGFRRNGLQFRHLHDEGKRFGLRDSDRPLQWNAFSDVPNRRLQNELKGERGEAGVKGEKGEPGGGYYDPRFGGAQGPQGADGKPGLPVSDGSETLELRRSHKSAS